MGPGDEENDVVLDDVADGDNDGPVVPDEEQVDVDVPQEEAPVDEGGETHPEEEEAPEESVEAPTEEDIIVEEEVEEVEDNVEESDEVHEGPDSGDVDGPVVEDGPAEGEADGEVPEPEEQEEEPVEPGPDEAVAEKEEVEQDVPPPVPEEHTDDVPADDDAPVPEDTPVVEEEPVDPGRYKVTITVHVEYPHQEREDYVWPWTGYIPGNVDRATFIGAMNIGADEVRNFVMDPTTLTAIYGGEQIDEAELKRRSFEAKKAEFTAQLDTALADLRRAYGYSDDEG